MLNKLLVSSIDSMSEVAATSTSEQAHDEANKIDDVMSEFSNTNKDLKKKRELLKKTSDEISRMKLGSVAKVEQITTISKIRIIDPKKTADVLSGIRLSDESMKK